MFSTRPMIVGWEIQSDQFSKALFLSSVHAVYTCNPGLSIVQKSLMSAKMSSRYFLGTFIKCRNFLKGKLFRQLSLPNVSPNDSDQNSKLSEKVVVEADVRISDDVDHAGDNLKGTRGELFKYTC